MLEILNETLAGNVFAVMLVFVRLGAAVFLLPGFGDSTVSPRARLLFALVLSLIVTPVVQDQLPPEPQQVSDLMLLLFAEMIVGALYGTLMRLIMSVLQITGQIVSLNMGLANAFLFNPMFNSQSSLPSALLATAGLVLLFVTNLHHLTLMSLVDTYNVFPAGVFVPTADMADLIARKTMDSFTIGTQLAVPFIMVSLLFFMALGVIARIMPQMQIFFVALPVQQMGGIIMLTLGISAILMGWLEYADSEIGIFLNPP